MRREALLAELYKETGLAKVPLHTSSLRPHTLVAEDRVHYLLKAACTSSLRPHTCSVRPHTPVAEGCIHYLLKAACSGSSRPHTLVA